MSDASEFVHHTKTNQATTDSDVYFSVLKTELCHWPKPKDRDTISRSPVSLDGSLFHPSSSVRCLDYWLLPSMESSTHFHKHSAFVQVALSIIKQLPPPGMSLVQHMNCQLLSGLILPIITYGTDLFAPYSSPLDKRAILRNKLRRLVTNCFYSMPVSILPCVACLPSLDSLLLHRRTMATFRIACSSPLINPAAAQMPASFPAHSQKRATDSLSPLLVGLKQCHIPLRWDQHRPVPAVQFQLPCDTMCYSLCLLVALAKCLLLLDAHIRLIDQ